MLDPLYNGMGIRARVCVSPLSSYLYIISMVHTGRKKRDLNRDYFLRVSTQAEKSLSI